MRKKTTDFINGLHKFVVSDAQFRRDTAGKTAIQIQTKIRPLILRYWIQVSSSHGEQVLLLGREDSGRIGIRRSGAATTQGMPRSSLLVFLAQQHAWQCADCRVVQAEMIPDFLQRASINPSCRVCARISCWSIDNVSKDQLK